jgi:hypothetical protein
LPFDDFRTKVGAMARRIDPIRIDFHEETGAGLYRPVAFRFGATTHLPESKLADLYLAARRVGFQYDEFRMCWIRNYVTNEESLVRALFQMITAEGFEIQTEYPSMASYQHFDKAS